MRTFILVSSRILDAGHGLVMEYFYTVLLVLLLLLLAVLYSEAELL